MNNVCAHEHDMAQCRVGDVVVLCRLKLKTNFLCFQDEVNQIVNSNVRLKQVAYNYLNTFLTQNVNPL